MMKRVFLEEGRKVAGGRPETMRPGAGSPWCIFRSSDSSALRDSTLGRRVAIFLGLAHGVGSGPSDRAFRGPGAVAQFRLRSRLRSKRGYRAKGETGFR